jgi:hypothetical protein
MSNVLRKGCWSLEFPIERTLCNAAEKEIWAPPPCPCISPLLCHEEQCEHFQYLLQGVRDYESALRAQLAAFEEERVREKRTFQSIAEADRARIQELTTEIAGLRSELNALQDEW